jgi:hypothetical protein
VGLFVCWHLFFLLVRNPLDLWYTPFKEWCQERGWWPRLEPWVRPVDRATGQYGNGLGVEQGWCMFTPPLARSAPFLAARIDFTDGTSEVLRSDNEPDPTAFFRVGGWRQRKLEEYLVHPDETKLHEHEELGLWEAYARWSVRRWKARHPEDRRTPRQVALLRRRIYFPVPGQDPGLYAEPEVYPIGTFDPDGRLQQP